uniref:Ig-like domain-containing protein n=1 Tax=Naja naja TaxID=35670 RepID=A0A8C6XM72_NAJNA
MKILLILSLISLASSVSNASSSLPKCTLLERLSAYIRVPHCRVQTPLGGRAELVCRQRHPLLHPAQWTWLKNGYPIHPSNNTYIISSPCSTSLLIFNISSEDYGTYVCSLFFPKQERSFDMKVSLLSLPFSHVSTPAVLRLRRSYSGTQQNLHRPANYTWTILDFQGNILHSISNLTLWPWFPALYFDFAEMLVGVHGFKHKTKCDPSPREVWNTGPGLYICPGHLTDLSHLDKCGTISDWYCKSWQCVSTGKIWWTAPYTTDYIKAILGPDNNLPWNSCTNWACCGVRLNPMTVTFTSHGRSLPITEWFKGKRWGGRSNDNSKHSHPGNIFIIRLTMSLETSPPVGPNKQVNSPFLQPLTKRNNPLVSLVSSAHDALVAARAFPNNDSRCWLCMSSQPPFYEAIGSALPFANSTSDTGCRWSNSSITVSSIEGQGCCLGYVPSNFSHFCINASSDAYTSCTTYLSKERLGFDSGGWAIMYTTLSTADLFKRFNGQFFIPSNGSIWACSTGATACVSGDILHTQKAFCIQVYLLPKMSVFSNNEFLSRMETPQYFPRTKREMVTTMTLSLLLGLGAAGAATGIAGMVVADQNIRRLSAEIDDDLKRIEQSMVALQNSLTSLSKLFYKIGGAWTCYS